MPSSTIVLSSSISLISLILLNNMKKKNRNTRTRMRFSYSRLSLPSGSLTAPELLKPCVIPSILFSSPSARYYALFPALLYVSVFFEFNTQQGCRFHTRAYISWPLVHTKLAEPLFKPYVFTLVRFLCCTCQTHCVWDFRTVCCHTLVACDWLPHMVVDEHRFIPWKTQRLRI